MFGMPGGTEWLVILLIILVLFGGKKLPELMGGLGKGIKSFKKGLNAPDSAESIADSESKKEEAGKKEEKG